MSVQQPGLFAHRQRAEFTQSLAESPLAIEVGEDAIRVIDPKTNAVIASVSHARVTATPATYRSGRWYWSHNAFVENYLSTLPYLVVSVPGMPPLTIGCRDTESGLNHRFSWRGDVPVQNEPVDYVVSGADWLTLVEKFGLARYLVKHGEEGAARL